MVRYKSYVEYLEILERFDIPIEDRTTRARFEEALSRELGKFKPADTTPLWEANVWQFEELSPKGVRVVVPRYRWGQTIRFVIKGYRGLFGLEKMIELTGIRI
jgi:hypothetical protein